MYFFVIYSLFPLFLTSFSFNSSLAEKFCNKEPFFKTWYDIREATKNSLVTFQIHLFY